MHWAVVYHLVPTSNHNYDASQRAILGVVYHLVPTSNHNLVVRMHLCQDSCLSSCSYIKPQRFCNVLITHSRCLSSCSYIKPQHAAIEKSNTISCLSSCSYIKPQLLTVNRHSPHRCLSSCSYIKPQLVDADLYLWWLLFIILFLHQTTTLSFRVQHFLCCLSSCSYIKPQPRTMMEETREVVYHLVPTSNHNHRLRPHRRPQLFIILFLHQTTTSRLCKQKNICCLSSCSYIKPQRGRTRLSACCGCLSSCSYIKPQPRHGTPSLHTSCLSSCSYIKPQRMVSVILNIMSCLSSCSYIKPQRAKC